MKLPNRPKITDAEVDLIAKHYFPEGIPVLLLIGVRGYFLNTVGKPGQNDFNVWDDAMLVYENGTLIRTFNANTDPSKLHQDLAMLEPGIYTFYRGMHKNRIKAFRAWPEGVELPCRRQNFSGDWHKSTCSAINIHDGALDDTWSAGCQTVVNQPPHRQFNEFRDLVYRLMDKHKLETVKYLLVEEPQMRRVLDANKGS